MRTWQLVEGVPKTLQLVWLLHEMEPDPASSGCSERETGRIVFTTTEIINTLHTHVIVLIITLIVKCAVSTLRLSLRL